MDNITDLKAFRYSIEVYEEIVKITGILTADEFSKIINLYAIKGYVYVEPYFDRLPYIYLTRKITP